MGILGNLLPIIAGLGITAATGGFGAPLGAAVAGGGAAGAGAAGLGAGLGAAGAEAAGTAASTGLATGAATAGAVAPEALASAAPAIAAPVAAAPAITAPAITPNIGPIANNVPNLQPGFAERAGDWLGNHPAVPLLAAGALMGDKPQHVPQQTLNAAPVYSAPQVQPQKPGGIPDRQFQANLISNLRR